jgi:general secretion pathway protein I
LSPTRGLAKERPDAGFTILEVLIALSIVAVAIVAIGSVMSTNTRGVRKLEGHVALVETAQAVMATAIPPRQKLAPGTLSGELRDYRWQVDIAPVGGDWEPPADAKTGWMPELVRIHVRSPDGAGLTLATVRLMPRPQQ